MFSFSSINSAVDFFTSWLLYREMFSLLLLLFVSKVPTVRTKHNCTVVIENLEYVSGECIVLTTTNALLFHDLVHRPVSYKITHASFDFSDGNRSMLPCLEGRMFSGCCWLKLSVSPDIETHVWEQDGVINTQPPHIVGRGANSHPHTCHHSLRCWKRVKLPGRTDMLEGWGNVGILLLLGNRTSERCH